MKAGESDLLARYLKIGAFFNSLTTEVSTTMILGKMSDEKIQELLETETLITV
jgi:hypothetical protein